MKRENNFGKNSSAEAFDSIGRPYYEQAKLMLQILPHIGEESCFALKGGTALNLFIRDLPRLSVDIDLTYMPIESREESIKNIHAALERIVQAIEYSIPACKCDLRENDGIEKIFVRQGNAQVKIEPNYVVRGSVFPCLERSLSPKSEDYFEMSVDIKTLSLEDLYGSKICAALDRQHPRDFFDIKVLFENEGLTDNIRKAFVVYLASSDRPMNELLDPRIKDFRHLYENEFEGMTTQPVRYEVLEETRERLIAEVSASLIDDEKQFLLSMKKGDPKWNILGIPDLDRLPALQWKLLNINKMSESKRKDALTALENKLRT